MLLSKEDSAGRDGLVLETGAGSREDTPRGLNFSSRSMRGWPLRCCLRFRHAGGVLRDGERKGGFGMDLMVDRKELDKALRVILQGRSAQGPDVVDFTAGREALTVVVTGRSVEVAIEAAEIGSVSIPIEVVAKLKKVAKTYDNDRLRLRANEGRVRLEGMSMAHEGIRMRKIARRLIDIPEDARQMDVLSLRHIFTAVEIEDSELGGKVLDAEKNLADCLDSAARSLADYGISRKELRTLAETRVRENVASLRKALFSE